MIAPDDEGYEQAELRDGGDLLRFYRDFIADAPEELGAFPAFQIAPPLPFIPEDRHGDTFIGIIACWAGPLEQGERALEPIRQANTGWVRSYYDATAPHSEEGGYVNFMAGDDQDRVRANDRDNYERLVAVKRRYDPGNLFHLNQNVRP